MVPGIQSENVSQLSACENKVQTDLFRRKPHLQVRVFGNIEIYTSPFGNPKGKENKFIRHDSGKLT